MAARLAQDIPEGWYVNLGIGIPLLVGDYIPADREVVLQSENGIVGMGPLQTRANLDTWIVNAGKQNVTLKNGAAMVWHADSFAMIRGGHLDLCVLGSFEVAANGDFANWTTSLKSVPAVGGAMDLAVGAQAHLADHGPHLEGRETAPARDVHHAADRPRRRQARLHQPRRRRRDQARLRAGRA